MKKLLFLLAMLLLIPTAIAVAKDATLINFFTGDRIAVEVNSQEAQQYFGDDYVLETSHGYVENDGEMLGYSVVSDYYVYLSQSMSSSQTTVPVTTMDTTDDHTLTMAEIGSKVFLTIDPDDDDYKELVLCTGISGTSWTGCTRGLAFYGTSTAAVSANQKTHNSGAIVIMANTHYVYEEFMDKDTAETIGGVKTFSSYPQIETYVAPTANEEFVPKKYADDLTAQGVATTTESVFGGSYLGTRTEMASSTWDADMPTVLQTKYSTSSPDVRGVNVVVSENDGYIDQDWLDLSEDFSFSGDLSSDDMAIGGELTITASTTLNATTTLADITSGHTVSALIASTTITGATTPQPVYIGGDSGGVLLSDANDTDALDFTGFAITSATASGTVYVQTDGIVAGFTGLTPTSKYYVQNAVGTIGTSAGTYKIIVGIAISTTEILIIKKESFDTEPLEYVEIVPSTAVISTLNTWEDWDLSGSIPAGAKMADISVSLYSTYNGGTRKKGSSIDRRITSPNSTYGKISVSFQTELNVNRIVEKRGSSVDTSECWFICTGYWK